MDRRNFVTGIVGVFASIKVLASPRTVSLGEEGYTYRWGGKPETDDPRFAGISLPCGPGNIPIITLDGRDVSEYRIFNMKTGPDGYVEHFLRDERGKHYEEIYDEWDRVWIPVSEGYKYADYHSCPVRGERYDERTRRIAQRLERGRVRFEPVGGFPKPMVETTTVHNTAYQTYS